MTAPPSPLRPLSGLALRTLAWMPVTFFLWYLAADPLHYPLAWGLEKAANLFRPGLLQEVDLASRRLILLTGVTRSLEDGRAGFLQVAVHPMTYTWNLPMLAALTLAAGGRAGECAWRLGLAWMLLFPAHLWGVFFRLLVMLTVMAPPELAGQVGVGEFGKKVVIRGELFGFLVLPFLSAVVIWAALHMDFLRGLRRTRGGDPFRSGKQGSGRRDGSF